MAKKYSLPSYAQSGGLGTTDDPDLAQALAFAQQYDPNAHIERMNKDDPSGGFDKVVFDESKLPQLPKGMTYDYAHDVASGYGDVVAPLAGPTHAPASVRTSTAGSVFDKNFGWIAPTSNWRSVTEKENNAAQNASGGWFSAIGNAIAPSDRPWMALVSALMAGAVPALGSALGGGLAGAAGQAALRTGVSAATGGNPFSNPLSILSSLAPAGLGELGVPSDIISGLSKGVSGLQFGLGVNDYLQGQKQYNAPQPATTTPLAPPPVIGSKPIPDVFNAAAFGGAGGSGSTAQVVSDGGAPVATSFAPDAYSNSSKSSQIIS